MSDYFFPQLLSVEALAPHRLQTTWSTGEVLALDVAAALHQHAELASILVPEVFAKVHLGEAGRSIEWLDEEFSADNAYAWAKEQAGAVSHQMFGEWMHRNELSLTKAADALGLSRRMVSYYRTAQKNIPRAIWLACLGWEATRPNERTLPRRLPTAQEYATLHA